MAREGIEGFDPHGSMNFSSSFANQGSMNYASYGSSLNTLGSSLSQGSMNFHSYMSQVFLISITGMF